MIDKEKSCDTPPKTKNKTQNQECPLFRVCAVRSVHTKTSIYFVIAFIYTMILLCIHINITYIYCSKTLSVTLYIQIYLYTSDVWNTNKIMEPFIYTNEWEHFFKMNINHSNRIQNQTTELSIVKLSIFVCFAHPIEAFG